MQFLRDLWNLGLWKKAAGDALRWGIGPGGEVSPTRMSPCRALRLWGGKKKQFCELICNRLDSLTQCKSATATVEIFGYADERCIDKKAYGELNPWAHPSTRATLHPSESCSTLTPGYFKNPFYYWLQKNMPQNGFCNTFFLYSLDPFNIISINHTNRLIIPNNTIHECYTVDSYSLDLISRTPSYNIIQLMLLYIGIQLLSVCILQT